MAFKIDDLIIDSIDVALATDFNDVPQYALTQLSEATIDITAESTDSVDKNGTLIKRVWKGKTGTFSAQNAMVNLNIIGAMSGKPEDGGYKTASASSKIVIPKIFTISGNSEGYDLEGYDVNTCSVSIVGQGNNGATGNVLTQAETATTAGTYAVGTNGHITFSTNGVKPDKYLILYKRPVSSGVSITNRADKFPATVRLYIKALCYDPCTADTLRSCIIYLPSFQVSPEVSISMASDATIEYTGDLQVDYCGDEKVLYQIFVAEND